MKLSSNLVIQSFITSFLPLLVEYSRVPEHSATIEISNPHISIETLFFHLELHLQSINDMASAKITFFYNIYFEQTSKNHYTWNEVIHAID